MRRLSNETLSATPASLRRPAYDREKLGIGLAHIGVGAFHRCHQAEFTDDLLEARFGPWGILGINLRPPSLSASLAPQDGLYTRTLRQDAGAQTRVIGALRRTIDVADAASAEAVVAALASPEIQAVTMTVTEKGYCLTPATGALDRDNAALAGDLEAAWPPRTLLGLLAAALERRRATSGPGLTLLSCDNIPANGERLRHAVLEFAATRSATLAMWIENLIAFPSAMVDRIVPATTPEDIATITAQFGVLDEAAVFGEPFRQWAIEDRFARERPPWDLAGAQFVRDVSPFEHIKMRVLNAAQSTLSHQGALVGYAFSSEAATDPLLSTLARRMLERETASTLGAVEGVEVAAYIDSALARIRNTAIRHRCHQIGTDGSQKIVQRLLAPLRARLANGQRADLLILALASWLAYALAGARRFGARWTPVDPWAATLVEMGARIADFAELARAALSIAPVFSGDLARPEIVAPVARHLEGLLGGEARAYLAERLCDG